MNPDYRIEVSIHAPAWGATSHYEKDFKGARVSIHAPAWGATIRPYVYQVTKEVSIHAPAWGATGPEWTWTGR